MSIYLIIYVQISGLERKMLGWREGGEEGVFWKTKTYQDAKKEENEEVLV